jgi:GTP:adenosylcobinamide-phosphate guanylyltransferase
MKVDAILPAGGRIAGEFAKEAGAEIKALIALDGRTVLERTLETLRATGRVERAVVIGPEELNGHPAARAADAVLPEGASGIDNLFHGIEWLRTHNGGQHAERVLVVTTDLPFLTPEAICGFLDACPPHAAVCLPVIRREEFEARFPDSRSDFVRLRDGEWTMGCAFLVDPAKLTENRCCLERVFQARKSQIGMLRLLGLPFILRWLTKRLTVDHVEARCAQILRCMGAAVRGGAPELAFDIDLPEEYRFTLKELGRNDLFSGRD